MRWNRLTVAILGVGILAAGYAGKANAEPVQWRINSTPDGWRLLRENEPFDIQGAVAPNRFEVLKARGGNAVRVPATRATLDAAHAAGLAVMANLPVRGERNQLDWNNDEQVSQQKEKVLAIDPLAYTWDIRPEVVIPAGSYAGGLEKRAEPIPGLIPNPAAAAIEFITPDQPGPYRLFVTVTDGQAHIAYGNVPFYVQE